MAPFEAISGVTGGMHVPSSAATTTLSTRTVLPDVGGVHAAADTTAAAAGSSVPRAPNTATPSAPAPSIARFFARR
ncbi:hypothetical protein EON67_03075 [archaeon]|nr:MAG: hypothetical protein EON67_03075 [archaeon]